MKNHVSILACVLALALPVAGSAQSTVPYGDTPTGTRELSLGGGGASNNDLDDSFGALNFSYGYFLGPELLLALRQDVSYANPRGGDTSWNGATRLALSHHLGSGSANSTVRPFIGISAGRIYGDNVRDTWAAGLETGAKFYVQQRTFVFLNISYDWLFEDEDDIDDTFGDGRFGWGLGVGFNF